MSRNVLHAAAAALALGLAAAAGGCGPTDYVLAPVSGRVTIDGQPYAGVRVAFEPMADATRKIPGPEAIAITDADGRFTLYTTDEERRGAVVGKCRVRIWTIPGEQGGAAEKAVVFDDRDPNYDPNAEIRALKAQIRAGASKKATPKGLGIIPHRFNDNTELTFEVPPAGTDKADFAISWQ
ncbi:MAG: DUF4198 domain-containing protein [Thermoleophilia bacterium]|nr:DUF4198 domain-containing protein [Thermoleophilia bacterium]